MKTNENKVPSDGGEPDNKPVKTLEIQDVAKMVAPGAVIADKILSDETGRQVVRDVGVPLLAKKNPAAAAVLGGVVALYDAKDAQKIRKPSEQENPKPGKKKGRGL